MWSGYMWAIVWGFRLAKYSIVAPWEWCARTRTWEKLITVSYDRTYAYYRIIKDNIVGVIFIAKTCGKTGITWKKGHVAGVALGRKSSMS